MRNNLDKPFGIAGGISRECQCVVKNMEINTGRLINLRRPVLTGTAVKNYIFANLFKVKR